MSGAATVSHHVGTETGASLALPVLEDEFVGGARVCPNLTTNMKYERSNEVLCERKPQAGPRVRVSASATGAMKADNLILDQVEVSRAHVLYGGTMRDWTSTRR